MIIFSCRSAEARSFEEDLSRRSLRRGGNIDNFLRKILVIIGVLKDYKLKLCDSVYSVRKISDFSI